MKNILKFLSPVIISLIIGVGCGKIMFNQYNTALKKASSEVEMVYFIQQGVYSNYDSMIENTKNIEHFIYTQENEKYYVFLSITKEDKNKEKLLNYYKNQKIDVISKDYKISNKDFLVSLNQYDQLLLATEDNKVIESIIKQVLTKYKETVKE